MQQNLLDRSVKRQQRAVLSIMHLVRLGVRSSERFTQHQLNVARLVLEGNRRQVKQVMQADGARTLLNQQPRLVADMGLQVLQHALETLEILSDIREALGGWLEEGTNATRARACPQPSLPLSPPASAPKPRRRLH